MRIKKEGILGKKAIAGFLVVILLIIIIGIFFFLVIFRNMKVFSP